MSYKIEEISPKYDIDICKIIKSVGEEFGAVGEGFGPGDEEVRNMSKYYGEKTKSIYFIAIKDGEVVGGCGISNFDNDKNICELRKLFILKEVRGLGIGRKLVEKSLEFAKENGYKECYLDTLSNMKDAIKLYKKLEFKNLSKPLEGVVHTGCDVWMIKTL